MVHREKSSGNDSINPVKIPAFAFAKFLELMSKYIGVDFGGEEKTKGVAVSVMNMSHIMAANFRLGEFLDIGMYVRYQFG